MPHKYIGRDATKMLFPLVGIEDLDVMLYGGNINKSDAWIEVGKKTVTLSTNKTNYVYVDWDTNEIAVNDTGFPKNCVPLYMFVTDAVEIIQVTDCRSLLRESAHSEFVTLDDWLKEISPSSDIDWSDFNLSAVVAIPKGATGIWLEVHVKETGTVSDATYIFMRKPGEAAVSQWKAIMPQASGHWFTRMVPVALGADGKTIQFKVNVDTQMEIKVALAGWIFG